MATVQKGSKINFYKFVSPPAGGSSKEEVDAKERTKVNKVQVEALNNLGGTVNGIASILVDLKTIRLEDLEEQRKNRDKFKPEFIKKKKKDNPVQGFVDSVSKGKAPGFLESLLNFFGGLFKKFVLLGVLRWMADPKNREKLTTIVKAIGTFAKFIFDVVKFGFVNTIEGLYKLLSDDTSWWEKLIGFGQALLGIGTLFLTLRWLGDWKTIVTDFGSVLKLFRKGLVRAKLKLLRHPLVLAGALVVGTAGAAIAANQDGTAVVKDPKDPDKSQMDEINESGGMNKAPMQGLFDSAPEEEKVPQRAQGGTVPFLAGGGWINGPQSGYPVSMDGGRSTAFIGHGLEYVAQKAEGGFVIPFDTPATRRQPHLTQKRLGEAQRGGYLKGYEQGGEANSNAILDFMKNFGTGVRDTAQQGVMNVAGLFPGGQEATLKTQVGIMNLFGIDSNDLSQQHNQLVTKRMQEAGAEPGEIEKKLINSKDEKQSFMDRLAGVPGLGWLGRMLGGESPDKEEDDKKKKKEETFDLTRFSSILSMRGAASRSAEERYNPISNPSRDATSAQTLLAGTATEDLARGDGTYGNYMPSNPAMAIGGSLPQFSQGGETKKNINTSSEKTTEKGTKTETKGGGQPAVIAGGKWVLGKGFTVAEHPNFRKNNFKGKGANTGVGFNPQGGERVGGHSANSAHYKNLALDITDWRPGNWKARTSALAQEAYDKRDQLKLTQIIHDGWGSWFAGEGSYTPGPYGGHPEHLHLAFAKDVSGITDAETISKALGEDGANLPDAGPKTAPEENLLLRMMLAEASGEGELGMALVARSILNRSGIVQSQGNPGLYMAKSGSLTDIMLAPGQFQPISDGRIKQDRTQAELEQAKRALAIAQNTSDLRGRLEAQGVPAEDITKLVSATGFRTGDAFNDESQNVNVVKFKNHVFNTAGNPNLNENFSAKSAEIGSGGGMSGIPGAPDRSGADANEGENKQEFDLTRFTGSILGMKGASAESIESRMGYTSAADGISAMGASDFRMNQIQQRANEEIGANDFQPPEFTPPALNMNSFTGGQGSAGGDSEVPGPVSASSINPSSPDAQGSILKKSTVERNAQLTKQEDATQDMSAAAISLAGQMNQQNAAVAAQMNQQGSSGGGGGGGSSASVVLPPGPKTTVNRLNSFVNPLNNYLKS